MTRLPHILIFIAVIMLSLPARVVSFATANNGIRRVSNRTLSMSRKFPLRMPTSPIQKSKEAIEEEKARVARCKDFLDSSPEPFHVVKTVATLLQKAGYKQLDTGDLWKTSKSILPGGKYYFTENDSTIVAFAVGEKFKVGGGFKVIGSHTDSPNLKLKPCTKRSSNKVVQLSVECYGGGLWHTWFDRDLSLAGRVIVRQPDGGYKFKLVKINDPILRIPNLCIHLKSPDEREAFRVNKEEHLQPLLCDEVEKVLGKTAEKSEGSSGSGDEQKDAWAEVQQSELLTLLAAELGCSVEDIADFELSLFDTQGASVSGLNGEYLCSSRLDNLASCFVSVEALLTHTEGGGLAEDGDVNMIALFDHEEVGSSSGVGAGSTIMRDSVTRISNALHALEDGAAEDSEIFKAALKKSMILSVDMAHAIHPNYASKHDKGHAPRMNSGIVIKSNANQRYMTNGMTGFFVRELARTSGVPVQEFAVRNDCPCGSTIGPIIASNTGIRAVDLGMPQLSMHSIREMMGCSDLTFAHALFVSFFKDFRAVDSGLTSEL